MQMFHVDARALNIPNRTSRHTSFECLYNLDSKKTKRLHIIFRSLWFGARFVPSVDLGKQCSDSSKIWFFVCNLDFWWFFVKVNEWQNLSCRAKGSRDNMKAFLLFDSTSYRLSNEVQLDLCLKFFSGRALTWHIGISTELPREAINFAIFSKYQIEKRSASFKFSDPDFFSSPCEEESAANFHCMSVRFFVGFK